MGTRHAPLNSFEPMAGATHGAFAPMSSARMFILGGIALIVAGMIFGDIFAVFVLHQNAGRIGERLLAATQAVAAGDAGAITAHFASIESLLENRGTKVDAHVHVIDFGYLALLLALVQPYVSFSAPRKKFLAKLFLFGAIMLPISVFLVHYVGLSYSPFQFIGWGSIFADLAGLLVILACAAELAGLVRYLHGSRRSVTNEALLRERSWTVRALLSGGTLLVLAGFLHGAYYAGADLYEHEARDGALLRAMLHNAAQNNQAMAAQAVDDYGSLQGEMAVEIAAHAHIIEFGFLAILMAFVQPYVFLSEPCKRRWAATLLLGGLMLPVFVLLELRWGLLAGGLADVGGLLVIVALSGMFAGVLRYTGKLDAEKGVRP